MSAEEEVVNCIDRCITLVMCGTRREAEVDEGSMKIGTRGPRFDGVVGALDVIRSPCCIEVATKNGAGQSSLMVFVQKVLDLVKDVLRRCEMPMP